MDKEQAAIERLKTALEMSLAVYGIPHNYTAADAPETVYFIREEFYRLEQGDTIHNRIPRL